MCVQIKGLQFRGAYVCMCVSVCVCARVCVGTSR